MQFFSQVKVTIKEKYNELVDDTKKFVQSLQEQNKPKVICNPEKVSHSTTGIPVGKIRTPE